MYLLLVAILSIAPTVPPTPTRPAAAARSSSPPPSTRKPSRRSSSAAATASSPAPPPSTDCTADLALDTAGAKLATGVAHGCCGGDGACGTMDDEPLAAIGWDVGQCP
jgi:hypothetical protein